MPKRKYHRCREKKYIRVLGRQSSSDASGSDESSIRTKLSEVDDSVTTSRLSNVSSDSDSDKPIERGYDFFKRNVVAASSPFPSDDESSISSLFDDENDLYRGSSMSLTEFNERLNNIATKHCFSDKAISDVLKLFADVLPCPNICPSLYQFQKKEKTETTVIQYDVKGGIYYSLSVSEQIRTILARAVMFNIPCRSEDNLLRDIADGDLFPPIKNNTIYLIMNTDGLSPMNSKSLSVWPILFSIVNLPPIERRLICNIVMAGFFVGATKPPWNDVLTHIIHQLKSGMIIDGAMWRFEVVILVADLPAKSSICNTMNFNSK